MRRALGVVFWVLLSIGCTGTPIEVDDSALVRWGSSFGMCEGYCREVLEVTPTRARLTASSRDGQKYPARTSELPITASEWRSIQDRLDPGSFERLDSTYGCPDCADGGAEWVEVGGGGVDRRVTFEFGRSPAEVADVVDRLRAVRERFPSR